MAGNTGRRSSRKGAASATAPVPKTAGASTAAAVRAAAARRRAAAAPVASSWNPDERRPVEDLDLTDPDDLEVWMAGELRDWQLMIGAQTLDQLATILQSMLDPIRTQREAVKNDLRQEGYLEGQINVLETVLTQVKRAVEARHRRIGEAVKE